jgi:hypothetical protein
MLGLACEWAKACGYFEAGGERLMNRTAIGDRQESRQLFGIQRTIQLDDTVDMVKPDGFLSAIDAVTNMVARVSELY